MRHYLNLLKKFKLLTFKTGYTTHMKMAKYNWFLGKYLYKVLS